MKKKEILKRILLLDNYDSFTYNLKHYLSSLGNEVTVVRNDEFDFDFSNYTHVVLSPGPGLPKDAGVLMDVIDAVNGKIPVLGVCLGMQAIGQYLGGELYNQNTVKHGVSEVVNATDSFLFANMLGEMKVGLYHSWAINDRGDYRVIATSGSGVIMGIENREKKLVGVQFHPESIMTENGKQLLLNFLQMD